MGETHETFQAFDYLTKHQACERLDISRPTLDRRVRAGQLTPIYPFGRGRGRLVLFDAREIERFLNDACSS